MKTCAIYARVSTNDQSCELQIKELVEFAARRDWKVILILEEKISGTIADRPKLKELLSAARSRKIDVVLIWKLDRLFRSLKNLVTTVIEFGELNVEFVSLRDHIDLTTASGRLMMHILASFAEFEASLIRERCKSGLEHAKRNGVKLGRPRTIKQDQVIDLRKQGLTFRAIANKLQISHGAVAATLKTWSQNPPENQPQTNV